MSSNTSTRKPRTADQRLIETMAQLDKDFVQRLKVISSDSAIVFTGLGGSAGRQAPAVPSPFGNFLKTSGGAMQGAIAFNPLLSQLIANTLDVTPLTGHYTGYLIVSTVSGLTGQLNQIVGAHDDGQVIWLQAVATETITIKNDPSGVGSGGFNIRTPGLVDYILKGPNAVLLYFDPVANQWAFLDSSIFDNVTTGGNPATWSQFPATQTVDFANNILKNVHTIYQNLFGSPEINFGSNFIQIIANGSGSHLDFYTHGGVEVLELDETQIQILEQVNFNNFDIVGISDIQWEFGDKIFDHSGVGFEHFVQGSQTHHKFQYSTTLLADINTATIDFFKPVDMHDNVIRHIDQVLFNTTGKIIADFFNTTTELAYLVGTNQKHSFYVQNGGPVKVFDVGTELDQTSTTVKALIMDSSAFIDFNNISLSATIGTITPPAKVLGYFIAMVGGNKVKVPFYGL